MINDSYDKKTLFTVMLCNFIFHTFNYSTFAELVFVPYHTVPYPNQTLKANFSKTTRQKLKAKLYSDRASVTL